MPNAWNAISGTFDFKGVNYTVRERSPTAADYLGYYVPTIWVNSVTNDAFILTDNGVGSVEWLQIGNGFHFQEAVLAIADDTAVPPTENAGDRYILDDTGAVNAAWDGASVWDVVEFDGSLWQAYTPVEGTLCYNDDDNRFYVFDGTSWNIFSSVIVEMTETIKGVGELATDAEAIAGALNDYHVVNPAALKAKLGTQTQYAIATGAGTTNALSYVGPLTDGQLLIGNSAGAATAGTITGGTGTAVTNAGGSITIDVTGGGVSWVTATADTNAAVNTGYITKHGTPASQLVYTLPAVAAVGSIIKIVGNTVGGWKVAQNAGQQIIVGAQASTSGTGGYIASNDSQYNTCTLLCTTADTTFQYIDGFGTIAIV